MSTPYSGEASEGFGQADYSQVQPDYGTRVGEEAVTYASWGARLGALLIDSVFLFVLQMVLVGLAAALGAVNETLGMIVTIVAYLGVTIWFMLLEAGPYGQTPGKAAVNIQVRKADGQMLSKGASVGRYFARILSTLPLLLGYFWPLWDAENRTFHDMVVKSRVVKVRESASFGQVIKGPFTRSGR